jgi:hypothetical protein
MTIAVVGCCAIAKHHFSRCLLCQEKRWESDVNLLHSSLRVCYRRRSGLLFQNRSALATYHPLYSGQCG